MTKTPMDEFLDALRSSGIEVYALDLEPDFSGMTRSQAVQAVWEIEAATAPPGAMDGPDGKIMAITCSGWGDVEFVYEKVTYGDQKVIECEGVVVCRLMN